MKDNLSCVHGLAMSASPAAGLLSVHYHFFKGAHNVAAIRLVASLWAANRGRAG